MHRQAPAPEPLAPATLAVGHSKVVRKTLFTFRLVHAALLVSALTLSAGVCAQLPAPSLKPDGDLWDTGAGFDFDLGKNKLRKVRQSVSALACNLDARQRRICLVAFDEGAEARYAYIGEKTLAIEAERIVLRAGSGELDAEGAATDGHYFYVAGSHSARRKDCASNPDSRHVLRFRLDPVTGRALRSPAGSGALVDYADTGKLWPVMQGQPGLAPYVGERKCLGDQQGVNIEGLAVQGGRLYFGFRGPVLQGLAQVLAVDADALFSAGAARDAKATLTRLALGQNRGIRDMVAVKKGFLLLAGPDDGSASQDVGWVVAWWDGQPAEGGVVQPKILAALDLSGVKLRKCDKEIKPEAMTVLEETPAAYKLLMLSDGLCDGGPLAFTLAR